MSIHKTEAFIIKTVPFRSSSLIVTCFTKQFGKVRGIAKGVHREREIRQAGYELFNRVEIVFYEKKRSDLHLITEAEILDSHDAMRNRLEGIAYASYFCELADELTEIHDPHPKLFDLLKAGFHFLPVISPGILTPLFEIQLVREMGWIPFLDSCLGCGMKPLEKGFFSIRHGAIFCEKCRSKDPAAQLLGPPVLLTLRAYSQEDFETCLRMNQSRHGINQIGILTSQFLNYRLGKVLKSRKFLESIKPALK